MVVVYMCPGLTQREHWPKETRARGSREKGKTNTGQTKQTGQKEADKAREKKIGKRKREGRVKILKILQNATCFSFCVTRIVNSISRADAHVRQAHRKRFQLSHTRPHNPSLLVHILFQALCVLQQHLLGCLPTSLPSPNIVVHQL